MDNPARPRRRILAGLGLTAVVAATIVGWAMTRHTAVGDGMTDEQHQVASCLDQYSDLELPTRDEPEQRLLLRDGPNWLRIYVSAPNKWIGTCQGGPQALMGSFATIMDDGPADQVRFYGGFDAVAKGHLLLGHAPAGVTGVDANLADGNTVHGHVDGDIFVVWAPGVRVLNSTVTAHRSDAADVTVPAPTE
ncbi:hypothetical protein AB0H43_22190 [Hamadaea sp. NPDC050747]|uniref:hypothetical protein n=1 Tax=Hamadaea sp. NPDC050747 TaxID=3155789 RepID=UPI0033CE58DB